MSTTKRYRKRCRCTLELRDGVCPGGCPQKAFPHKSDTGKERSAAGSRAAKAAR